MAVVINPYAILAAVLFWLASCVSSFMYGRHVADAEAGAKAGTQAAAIEAREDLRDTNIEAISAATGAAVAKALTENRGAANARTDRIRTVEVPGDCRAVPADIVRDLQGATDDVNAALGVGMRPRSPGASAFRP